MAEKDSYAVTLALPLDFSLPAELRSGSASPADHATILRAGCVFLTHCRDQRMASADAEGETLADAKRHMEQAHAQEVARLRREAADSAAVARDMVHRALEQDMEQYRTLLLQAQTQLADRCQQAANEARREAEARIGADRDRLQQALLSLTARQANSSTKGRDNERDFAELLDRSFGTARQYRVLPHRIESGDHLIECDGLMLMFENKKYVRDVTSDEVAKAHRDFRAHPECHALVFISHDSSIVGHQRVCQLDLEREAGTGRPMLYIGRFDAQPDPVHFLLLLRAFIPALCVACDSLSARSKSPGLCAEKADEISTELRELWADFERTCADVRALFTNMKKHKRSIDRVWREMSQEVTNVVSSFEARIAHRRSGLLDADIDGCDGEEASGSKKKKKKL